MAGEWGSSPCGAAGHNPKARTRIPDGALLDDSHTNFGRLLEKTFIVSKSGDVSTARLAQCTDEAPPVRIKSF